MSIRLNVIVAVAAGLLLVGLILDYRPRLAVATHQRVPADHGGESTRPTVMVASRTSSSSIVDP